MDESKRDDGSQGSGSAKARNEAQQLSSDENESGWAGAATECTASAKSKGMNRTKFGSPVMESTFGPAYLRDMGYGMYSMYLCTRPSLCQIPSVAHDPCLPSSQSQPYPSSLEPLTRASLLGSGSAGQSIA